MDDAKVAFKTVIFLFLAIFPFGQLLRWQITFGDRSFVILAIDVVVIVSVFLSFFTKFKIFPFSKFINAFLIVILFSYLFSLSQFKTKDVLVGGLYMVRVFSYLLFSVLCWGYFKNHKKERLETLNMLLGVGVFTAIFGWVQYFLYPDLRPYTVWGWDDHLYRLTGTFFDPGFTSIIIVLAALLALLKYIYLKKHKLSYDILLFFLLLTIAFTYSRAGFLAFIFGLSVILILKKKIKLMFLGITAFAIIILALPTPSSEGVNLLRSYSVNARIQNYKETLRIWSESPLLGVGFNNICLVREQNFGDYPMSHSCSGSDSSVLLLLATTGVLGVMTFIYLISVSIKSVGNDLYGYAYLSSLSAILVHSLFVNSLFYPWVLGWMAIIAAGALSLKKP